MCIHLCLHPLTIAFVRRIDSAVGSIVLLHVPVVYYWILRLTVVGDLGFPTPNFKIPISKRSEHDTAPTRHLGQPLQWSSLQYRSDFFA